MCYHDVEERADPLVLCTLFLVQPSDISPRQGYPYMLFATLAYSDKCLMGGAGGAEEVNTVLDMLDIVFGRESLICTPRILAILNSTSPYIYAIYQFERIPS